MSAARRQALEVVDGHPGRRVPVDLVRLGNQIPDAMDTPVVVCVEELHRPGGGTGSHDEHYSTCVRAASLVGPFGRGAHLFDDSGSR
ncbi:MAG: hypothetical protein JWO88_930 [Frankiales bacterium]|nr:hypothetical protein [Frankiales bacterium]